jgi:hypothetical protein
MVAQELEHGPGKPVRARLGHRADGRARVHPVFGREPLVADAEFLERIGKRQREVGIALRVVVRRTIQRVGHAERQAAGHRDLQPATGRRAPVCRSARPRPPSNELGRVATVERQLQDSAHSGRRLLIPRALDIDDRCGALDRYRFFDIADCQHDVDVGVAPTCRTMPVCA